MLRHRPVRPQAHVAIWAVKTDGGWAVVSIVETEIHRSSDISPSAEQRLWDEQDIPALRFMTDAVNERGVLAAIELMHNRFHVSNLSSRTRGCRSRTADIEFATAGKTVYETDSHRPCYTPRAKMAGT